MKYETAESWHNLNARKLARYDEQQRALDAQRTPWGGPNIQTMRANPRKVGEDLIAYVARLKEVAVCARCDAERKKDNWSQAELKWMNL